MKYEVIINEQSEVTHYTASFYAAKKLIKQLRKVGFKVYSAVIIDLRTQTEYIL